MRGSILVVTSNRLNRQKLCISLSDEYELLYAENRTDAMAILNEPSKLICAVLVDISSCSSDAESLMADIKISHNFSDIPVVAVFSKADEELQLKALTLGAAELIELSQNHILINRKIHNLISLSESAFLSSATSKDKLTGLINREAFFKKASKAISEHEPGFYVMACFDINNFKVINDQYGRQKGDFVLKYIANTFDYGFNNVGGFCCRISADNFAVLYPASLIGSDTLAQMRNAAASLDGSIPPISFSIGRYIVNDTSLDTGAMYDRAAMAEASIKGRFDTHIALFDDKMRLDILREQEIITEMNEALETGQFEVWFQPQYNHSTGALIGTESLVRWRHPKKGIVLPAEFVPVFERNGFIYELDKYVWEQTCIFLRKWIDNGHYLLPASVNISRYDIFREDMVDTIAGLIKKYDIPTDMLRLEITESAFAKSTQQIIDVVKELVTRGFTVEIDDFGSGYSSLNTLKDVPVNVLKLDLCFLKNDENSSRGGNILESIVRMAKWLDMYVIAEGVETIEQANYLKSIGCNYVQGHLYSKPIPANEYEKLCEGLEKEAEILRLKTVEKLDNSAFWDPKSMDTLIFNSYIGGACIFEYHDKQIDIIRSNDKYATLICGKNTKAAQTVLKISWEKYLDEKSLFTLHNALRKAIKTGEEITNEYKFLYLPNGTHETYLRMSMRVIASTGTRYLVYCASENITAQRKAEEKERSTAERMHAIMDNVNGGVSAVTISDDGKVKFIFANEKFYKMQGYTKKQFDSEVENALMLVHEDDREYILNTVRNVIKNRTTAIYEYRCINRSSEIRYIRCSASVTNIDGVSSDVLLSVHSDITELIQAQKKANEVSERLQAIMENVNSGVTAVVYNDKKINYIFTNNKYFEMMGYTKEQYLEKYKDGFGPINSLDKAWVIKAVELSRQSGRPVSLRYRVNKLNGEEMWVRHHIINTNFAGVEGIVQLGIMDDITDERLAEKKSVETSQQLSVIMNNIGGAVAAQSLINSDGKYIFVNDQFYNMYGYTKQQFNMERPGGISGLVFPEDIPIMHNAYEKLLKTGQSVSIEYRAHKRNGEIMWVRSNSSVCRLEGYDSPVQLSVSYDITKEKIAEDALRISEEETKLALAHMGKMICLYNTSTHVITLPEIYAKKHGYSTTVDNIPERFTDSEFFDKEGTDRLFGLYNDILCGKKTGTVDVKCKCSNAVWCWERYEFVSIFGRDMKPVKAVITIEDVTQQYETQVKNDIIRENERIFRAVAAHSNRLICRYDISTKISYCEYGSTTKNFPIPSGYDFPHTLISNGSICHESIADFMKIFSDIENGVTDGNAKIHLIALDNSLRWIDIRYTTVFDLSGQPVTAIISIGDITSAHEKELAFERYRQVMKEHEENDGIVYFEADLTADIVEREGGNVPFVRFPKCGCKHSDAVNYGINTLLQESDREKAIQFFSRDNLIAAFNKGTRNISHEWYITLPSKEQYWFHSEIQLILDPYSDHIRVYTVLRDVTQDKIAAIHVKKQAELDGMTGLYNKTTAEDLINKKLNQTYHEPCTLIIADMDNLKFINDNLGHDSGDKAIRDMAATLRNQFRKTDIIGRTGGDEFIVFLDGAGNEAKIRSILVSFMRQLSTLQFGSERQLTLTCSIGLVFGTIGKDTYEDLFKKADKALYHVKRNGKNDFAVYTPEMDTSFYKFTGHNGSVLWQTKFISSEELSNLLTAVSKIYPLVISANLTQNSYYMMQYNDFTTKKCLDAGEFDELIVHGASTFHPDDRKSFSDTFSRKSLIEAFERGQTLVTHNGRQLGDDGIYRYIRTDVILLKNKYSNDILDITLAREIS